MKQKITKKPKIVIGIPAYNEETTIAKILNALLKQKEDNYRLSKIIVCSDASTDATDEIVKRFRSQKVGLLRNPKQSGKTSVIKKLLSQSRKRKADFLILVDADLTLKKNNLISLLISTITKNNSIIAVSGFVTPHKPITFTQKIAYFGFSHWEKMIQNSGESELFYRSSDPLIALRVNEFPAYKIRPFVYMHDEFYFLYAKKYGKQFKFNVHAHAEFKLPANMQDYYKQMMRYLSSHIYGKDLDILGKEIPNFSSSQKIKQLLDSLKEDFISGISYFLVQTFLHISKAFHNEKIGSTWGQITSTK